MLCPIEGCNASGHHLQYGGRAPEDVGKLIDRLKSWETCFRLFVQMSRCGGISPTVGIGQPIWAFRKQPFVQRRRRPVSAPQGRKLPAHIECRMVGESACRLLLVEAELLEVARRHVSVAESRIPPEAEPAIVG